MSENVTFEYIVDEAEELLDEAVDNSDHEAYRNIRAQFDKCYLPFLIVFGVTSNILALTILIRRRLWLHHEAYIYLAAVLIANSVQLVVHYVDLCLRLFDQQLVRLSISADIICKLWIWALYVNGCMNWLHVLMLLNVYLRQQLITANDRRGCHMNLAAKYCTLFGTKVVISSFFTVCAVSNFWAFSVSILQHYYDNWWHCKISTLHFTQFKLLLHASWGIGCISLVIVLSLLLLVVWKRKRRSGFAFNQVNGATQENCDAEAIARIVLCCAAVVFVFKAPLFLDFISLAFNLGPYSDRKMQRVIDSLRLIAFSYPLSTPIVCFAVKSRFRDDLKAMVERCCKRCCPGARCRRTLPPEPESDRSSVLQMDPIEGDSPVTRTAEESDHIQLI